MPVRSWLPRSKMLATHPFAVKHVFRLRVSATDRAFIYFSLRSVVSSSLNFPCWIPLKVFDKMQSVYFGYFYFYSTKLRKKKKNDLCLPSHWDLSIEHICLGTNMADSNRRCHVGENQEYWWLISIQARQVLVVRSLWLIKIPELNETKSRPIFSFPIL